MKTQINSPGKSKINWTALAMAGAGVCVSVGLVPEDNIQEVAGSFMTVGGVAIAAFRTFFTKPTE